MFVREEVRLDLRLEAAQVRLANLIRGDWLLAAAQDTYGEGITGLLRVGPRIPALGLSRLVEVNFRDLIVRDGSAVLTLRWKAIGPGGALFPVLDADITLTPVDSRSTVLRLDGAYRPPLGSAGAGLNRVLLHRVATATIRSFIARVADHISQPDLAGAESAKAAEAAAAGCTPPALDQA
jgi:hypothetical protein